MKTQREFPEKFKSRSAPAKNTVIKIYDNFTSTAYIHSYRIHSIKRLLPAHHEKRLTYLRNFPIIESYRKMAILISLPTTDFTPQHGKN